MYDWEDPWVLSVYAHKIPPQFERKLIEIKNNVSSDQVDYCKRNLQYRAMVIFRLATDSMSVTVMSSRLSFFDKMSAFGKIASPSFTTDNHLIRYPSGGILGLFTGISILSMTEVVFWVLRYLVSFNKSIIEN